MQRLYPTGDYINQEKLCLIQRLRGGLPERVMLRLSMTADPQRNVQRRPKYHEKMIKTIHDIYSRDETFLDELAHDLDDSAVWFNDSEFARFHDIDGRKILSIFTSDTRGKTFSININDENNPELIHRSGGILYCRAQNIAGNWQIGASLRLDGRHYTVSEAKLIQDQVWRIVLEAKN